MAYNNNDSNWGISLAYQRVDTRHSFNFNFVDNEFDLLIRK